MILSKIKLTFFSGIRCRSRTVNGIVVDLCKKEGKMKILNVAEKNDAAKNIAGLLSGGNLRRRDGYSQYNKIYEFECNIFNQKCQMIMTSVSGHLLSLEFVGSYRKWQGCNPLSLFEAPVMKSCPPDYQAIKRTLEKEVRGCSTLIIWTDCDREGENIGFEIIQVCQAVKQNLRIYRAKFSEITARSVYRAIQTLGAPNKNISDAVDVRQELDLRIGAAFTRFQTLRLKQVFPQHLGDSLISYGSCQFPTLGFVVERYNAVKNFIPETFWKIKVTHTQDDLTVDFRWKRVHLLDELYCQVLYEICMERPQAKVENVQSKPKSKWRPLPLDTVEMEKLGSRKLRINAKEVMKIAEKLYTQGFISYPRTETNIFPKELNLRNLVQLQAENPEWGEFANRVLSDGPNPRQGKKSDQAHPPIHPTKHTNSLQGNERKVYEFVVRHFLACCSKDAEGLETIVDIDIAGEKFVANGLMIIARNYLEVYPYEKWNAKEIHIYQNGQTFEPTSIEMTDGETSPPNLLTEADLIALMEKHGIGTDATHAEHIEKIKSRTYVGLQDGSHFLPGHLGMGLVEGYDSMGFPMSKPDLRAELEADLKRICEGTKDPKVVLQEQLSKYEEVFRIALQQASKIDQALAQYLNETAQAPADIQIDEQRMDIPVLKCPSCGLDMVLRDRREGNGKYIGCMGFPGCNNTVWFPRDVEQVELSGDSCPQCGPHVKQLKFKFKRGALIPFYPDEYTGCIGGCDPELLELLSIRPSTVRSARGVNASGNNARGGHSTNALNDSGFGSGNSSPFLSTPSPITTVRGGVSRGRGAGHSTNGSGRGRGTGHSANGSDRGRTTGRGSGRGSGTSSAPSIATSNYTINNNTRGRGRGQGSSQTAGNTSRVPLTRDFSNDPEYPLPNSNWNPARVAGIENRRPEDNAVVCHCNCDAILLTVRKEGPNTGRKFYKCGKGEACKFFQWADDGDNPPDNTRRYDNGDHDNNRQSTSNSYQPPSWSMQSVNNGDGIGEVLCQCGLPGKRLTVQKEGPNKGRQFYACPKPQHERCNFFKWADEADNGGGGSTSWGAPPPTRGRGGGTKRTAPSTSGPPKKRKCSLCRQEGHTRPNCPNQ